MKTHNIIIIDRSGSMDSIAKDMEGGINSFIADQIKEEGDMTLTLVKFDSSIETDLDCVNIKSLDNYKFKLDPRNSTRLNDAVGMTIASEGQKLAAMKPEDRPDNVAVLIVTDGYENASREYTAQQVADMIEHQQTKYSWAFNFLGANQDSFKTAAEYGIKASNVSNFKADHADAVFSNYSGKMSSNRRGMGHQAMVYTSQDHQELNGAE